jgi:lysophospholipase L1-like esterase
MRSSSWTLALIAFMGLIGALALLVASSAAAKPVTAPPLVKGSGYLALGDSVTFGYQEPQVVPPPDYSNAKSFVAYPEMIGQELRLKVANAGCPGETSSSFISVDAQSNGCENALNNGPAYRKLYPLHVKYNGSQLAYAVKYLRKNRNVRLVSLMIGANDLFLCQQQTSDVCLSASEQQATFSKISSNVRTILSAIRNKAHYGGQIVLVNYFSLNYGSTLITGIVSGLNAALDGPGKRFGALVANGFGEFQNGTRIFGGDPCKAGLLTLLSTGSCGVHPSYSGQALLGQAVLKGARSGG